MSATNGERARFHRNRKKRVLLRMHLRAVMAAIKAKKAVEDAPPAVQGKGGPALTAEG